MSTPHGRDRMTAPTRRGVTAWLALLPLFGCASTEPDYYRLVMVPGATRVVRPLRVELRQLGLARYLDRPEIVRSDTSMRLDIRQSERWAEPIGDMVIRVLAENLNQRLPGSLVVPENSALGGDPTVISKMEITRFEADAAGQVVLEGWLQIRRLGGRVREVNRQVAIATVLRGTETNALAQSMSQALGLLADQIAQSTQELTGSAV